MWAVPKLSYEGDVFSESVERIASLYRAGHRVVVSFSAGKDSGVCLELALIAARQEGTLPVQVVMRDEEIMFPGTYEYAERVMGRTDVQFHWLVANQPIINVFNRDCPYWWVFDPLVNPEEWVRPIPAWAERIPQMNIERMADVSRFPPKKGKWLIHIIGLRTQESRRREWAVASAKGYMTKVYGKGERNANPIYDWRDGDVWKAIKDNQWDYNHAYDTMARLGVPPRRLRIAPPTMSVASIQTLKIASQAWPQWFERVCRRLPGVRAVARYGKRVVQPMRVSTETWEQCYQRTCIDNAPKWIRDRAVKLMTRTMHQHKHHSTAPFPQVERCKICSNPASWRELAMALYMGDPFCIRGNLSSRLPYVEPDQFRIGAGKWLGKPTW